MTMKKLWIWISGIVLVLAVLLISFVYYRYIFPSPIKVIGVSQSFAHDSSSTVLKIANYGFTDVRLIEVSVNDYVDDRQHHEMPKIDLGVRYANQLDQDSDRSYTEFVSIDDAVIHTGFVSEEQIVDKNLINNNIPIQYGIRISTTSGYPVEEVLIRYKYFGMTFTKRMVVGDWPGSNF